MARTRKTGYVSKGQRRNISRWLRNARRKENRKNPSFEAGLTRAEIIQAIITDYIPTLVDKWRGKKSVWTSQKKKEKTVDG